MKPYFEATGITIYHGRMEDYQDVGGDVLITDPSYGRKLYATDLAWDAAIMSAWVDRFGAVAVMAYPELLVGWCLAAGLQPKEWITWWPTNKREARGKPMPKDSEHIAIFGATPGQGLIMRPRSTDKWCRSNAIRRGLDPDLARESDVWTDPVPAGGFNRHLRLHPNEKPVSLGAKLVTLCSLPGQTVVDYFCGSGAFLLAATQAGRQAIGVDMDEAACETAANRFQGILL